jgi:hypothetical protein
MAAVENSWGVVPFIEEGGEVNGREGAVVSVGAVSKLWLCEWGEETTGRELV